MDLQTLANVKIGSISIGTICSAAITLVICLVIVRVLTRLITRLLKSTRLDDRMQAYVMKAFKAVAYIITAIMVIEGSGINTTSLVALLSVCSLGVTLAAEDILGNVAGGLVILTTRPFVVGNYIEADGVGGTVESIHLNHTRLLTPDGQLVIIPNRTLSSTKLTNYTAYGRRRVNLTVTASYDAPTETVRAACRKALEQTSGWLQDPAPAIVLSDYGDSAISYSILCWASAGDYINVLNGLRENVRAAFEEAGVEMTYNHLNVHIVESV